LILGRSEARKEINEGFSPNEAACFRIDLKATALACSGNSNDGFQ
jgi:hypothetical protein